MGIIAAKIKEIQKQENLTLKQVFEKYPHLAELQHEEQLREDAKSIKEGKKKTELLLG